MPTNTVPQHRLLILGDSDESAPDAAQSRGHLFEVFVARFLEAMGYEKPTRRHLNVKSDGIELDVSTRTRLDGRRAIAECKAYARAVPANELTNFYGKLAGERLDEPGVLGLMVVSPRLTADGEEKARTFAEKDKSFLYWSAEQMVEKLRQEGIVSDPPIPGRFDDPIVVITPEETFSAAILLDAQTKNPVSVAAWAATGAVPRSALDRLAADTYAQGMPVVDIRGTQAPSSRSDSNSAEPHILATVQASAEDFQYQLPAAPRFFVGRSSLLSELASSLDRRERLYVLNAQSGWGKSSLALKFAEMVEARGGLSVVMDTRTAETPRYVVEVLRDLATKAQARGMLTLPETASWSSLNAALRTLSDSIWTDPEQPVLIFFDQFENVFRSERLTRAFRDLALGASESPAPLCVGYAWKTDLVGWTENHPYQLRDEIRSHARVLRVDPFGSTEVTVLIKRLERQAEVKLVPDLRDRLREYSQGLPWLLKKLCDHVLRELSKGLTQEKLLAEALNVQSLFEADLAELEAKQREILNYVARYAPVPASEVTDRHPHSAVQSLVDRRLLVQIGDRLDTYWDTFRDYLNTGRVPVEDSYILRQAPNSVARMLPAVMSAGGSARVADLAKSLQTSDNVIFNLSRELRLLGVTAYEPLRVRMSESILQAGDPEVVARTQIAHALRRHRAFSTLRSLSERSGGAVSSDSLAKALPGAFPAVSVTDNTWKRYATTFLAWLEYAGLVVRQGPFWSVRPEGDAPARQRLLSARPSLLARPSVPQEAPRRPLELLAELKLGSTIAVPSTGPRRDAVRTLVALGAVNVDSIGQVRLADPDLVRTDGSVDQAVLQKLLSRAPGGAAGLECLKINGAASPMEVGETIKLQSGAMWTSATTHSIGGYFRSWAALSGMPVRTSPRGASRTARTVRADRSG